MRLSFATGMASSRETALALAQRYHEPSAAARTFALAFAHAQSGLRHLGISSEQALLFERLASRVLYADSSLRASPEVLARNTLGQDGLWAHGISGDLPILLVRVVEEDDVPLVRQVLQAQEYWRLKGLQRRRRDPQRAPDRLSRRDARAAHGPPRQRTLEDVEAPAGRGVPPPRRPHAAGRARPARRGGPRGPERRARRARQPARSAPSRAGASRWSSTFAPRIAAGRHGPGADGRAPARSCQRPGRLRRRGTRIRDRARRGPGDAPPLGQRHRQSRPSGRWSRPRGRPTRGRRTAGRTASLPSRTIP